MEQPKEYHRFLDEAGDTTFYGKGKVNIVGNNGVSNMFMIGMVKLNDPIPEIRRKIVSLQADVVNDEFYYDIPSIQKKKNGHGYFFHATDDIPEVREKMYRFLKTLDCSFKAVVARKIPAIFEKQHQCNESLYYADLLSHLLESELHQDRKLILSIAERGKSTKNNNLNTALDIAKERFNTTLENSNRKIISKIVFNVQTHYSEPLLNIADYFCWAIQRVFEKGEIRYYNYLKEKFSLIIDLYDQTKYKNRSNYYTPQNPLSAENKISPSLH